MTKTATRNKAADLPAVLEQRLGPISYRPLAEIQAYAGNPRKHPEKQIVQLMASMRHFGFALPLLVDVHGVLICGHARLEAARRLRTNDVPVLVAAHWSAAQVKAYRLADNQLATSSSWDAELLRIEISSIIELDETPIEILGWSTGEIDVILDGAAAANDDDACENQLPDAMPVSQPGDLWLLGKHRLLCGSSLEPAVWERLMNGASGAMVLTDAPFNVKVNGHVSGGGRHAEFAMASGEMSVAEFIDFNKSYLANMSAHLKDGAIVMAFMDHHHLFELMSAARDVGLRHLNLCVWAKTNGGMGSLYRSQHELVLVLKHGSAPHTNAVELGKHGRYRTNIWTQAGANAFGATRDADLADHPTVKPTQLLAEAIRDVTRQGEIVLDAFSGSGSTILACERTKRVGYAVEIEPRYIDVAIRRWEKLSGRKAVLEATGESFAEVAIARAEPLRADG
ncbi:DNA methylase N-4 [Sphingomonas sp. NBWT7]|uniref:site-specific DNA-methyltransferase n=1 Tax=Sphingomonas sp. NBWT7 TaxID=2596913 RepID=UPI001625CB00|nr:DNA methyltransferase [Sphingomonas sp. NBWT7]QNE33032.1 DNA methylase N-4 [Sphingomonas sp. NBWT7]